MNSDLKKIIEFSNKLHSCIHEFHTLLIDMEVKYKIEEEQKKTDFQKFKKFFLDNFEITNEPTDFVLTRDIIKWMIIHSPFDFSIKQYEMYMSRIIRSTNKRINDKIYKVKRGLKPIKLSLEF